jgi:hypothetical protein
MRTKQTLPISIFFALASVCYSQTKTESTQDVNVAASRPSVGFHLNQFQNDFGLGLDLTSPYFFKHRIALRASANWQWLQSISPTTMVNDWASYQAFKVGVTGFRTSITTGLYIYSEGGVVLVLPDQIFSDESSVMGGYGLFGFEFFANKSFCYYLEMGGMGLGEVAEKALYKPIYSNGFTASVGFRIHF